MANSPVSHFVIPDDNLNEIKRGIHPDVSQANKNCLNRQFSVPFRKKAWKSHQSIGSLSPQFKVSIYTFQLEYVQPYQFNQEYAGIILLSFSSTLISTTCDDAMQMHNHSRSRKNEAWASSN